MPKKEISISTCFNSGISIDRQIPMVSATGFSHISLGSDKKHFNYFIKGERRKLISLLEKYKIKIDTIHAPVTGAGNLISEIEPLIEAAIELKTPVIVAHGTPWDFPVEEIETCAASLARLCEKIIHVAPGSGIVFAIENVMPGPATELVKETVLKFDSPYIGFCYDSSHDQIDGPRPFDLLKTMKNKLAAVHISDRLRPFEDHVIPGEGFINFEELCGILSTSNIGFPLLLELIMTYSAYKESERFLHRAYTKGCELYRKIIRNEKFI